MNKFDTIIKEALSFKDTFKAPDEDEKLLRRKELMEKIVQDTLKKFGKRLPDGTWQIKGSLFLNELGIESLEGLNVSIVEGSFFCDDNKLTSLKGCPKKVERNFFCDGNLAYFSEDDVRELCEVGGKIYVNDDY